MKIDELFDYKLKKLLGDEAFGKITPDDKKFMLDYAKTIIQNYCHRKDIPSNLNYIWCDIAIDYFKQLNPSLFEEQDEEVKMKKLASITEGDTSMSFATSNNDPETLLKIQNNLVQTYQVQMQSFRKIASGCGCGLNGI